MPDPLVEQYDLYDIACLAGGVRRVVDAALVVLVGTGRVRRTPTGELGTVDPRRRHPVEAAVLDAIGTRPRHAPATVRWRVQADLRLAAVTERLITDGLLTSRRPP